MFYSLLWKAARPFLRKRLRDGFAERLVPPSWPFTPSMQVEQSSPVSMPVPNSPCQLWIQAASGGEAYLCLELLRLLSLMPLSHISLSPDNRQQNKLHVLCTTCTRQGLDILLKARAEFSGKDISVTINYLPLDEPTLMNRAVRQVFGDNDKEGNRLLVLLETEIWPGLIAACRGAGVRVLIINARMSPGSYRGYKFLVPLLRVSAPQEILAVSQDDLLRFQRVFIKTRNCGIMPNMKFDRINKDLLSGLNQTKMSPGNNPGLIVLGSVREEEEQLLLPFMRELMRFPLVIAPRHMQRVEAWSAALQQSGLAFIKRSAFADFAEVEYRAGRIVLWDVFGELGRLYGEADAVFVGGSLAPLGGQNFLEPIACGVCPCIGPYWNNFHWVGQEIFDLGLVTQVQDAQELVRFLLHSAQKHRPKSEVAQSFRQYLNPRLGGTKLAADTIFGLLAKPEPAKRW
ncbi:MAG: 3-deoxy-D-manno-octulosonic acid transferase [Deltaproteobacteria bacterium]|jgi:3-deoxy-D-manno-octulosonic-acid transferase|nr:3-deoxy-D-manno-octulosonic acid transferase [Deltaproteobacteria bacterium]